MIFLYYNFGSNVHQWENMIKLYIADPELELEEYNPTQIVKKEPKKKPESPKKAKMSMKAVTKER